MLTFIQWGRTWYVQWKVWRRIKYKNVNKGINKKYENEMSVTTVVINVNVLNSLTNRSLKWIRKLSNNIKSKKQFQIKDNKNWE